MTEQQQKYLKYGGIAVVSGVILYALLKPTSTTSGALEDPTGNGGVSNPDNFAFNAATTANKLYEAMRPSGYANILTNPNEETKIFDALKNVSGSQFGQVVTAFGRKTYNSTFGNQYFALWSDPEYHGLQHWLETELAEEKYNTLQMKYPNHL